MKIVHTEHLIDVGRFSKTSHWKTIKNNIHQAIKSIQWPPGSGSFTLYDQSGKKRGEGNGVKPIKEACVLHLVEDLGWTRERTLLEKIGGFDVTLPVGDKFFVLEWETGNVSSSHRAINKMCLGLLDGTLIGGVLVVPTRAMYKYLTDRVGNFAELQPYFRFWRRFPVQEGLLAVIAIEHDRVSHDVPRIPKGTDGRALQ